MFVDDETEQDDSGSLRRADAERELLRALLTDAIRCLLGDVGGGPAQRAELADDARAWIQNTGDHQPYSFENVCGWLELPADRLRRHLLEQAAGLRPRSAVIGRQGASRHPDALEARLRRERNARIKALRAAGATPREIAERFDLSYASIIAICGCPAEEGEAAKEAATG